MKQCKTEINVISLLVFIFSIMVMNGCKSISRVDELLLLKTLAEEQKRMGAEVSESDKKFEELLIAVESGDILDYKDQFEVKERFGSPIFIEMLEEEGRFFKRWLYRYSTQFFGSKKVYLYFDESGKFLKWDFVK